MASATSSMKSETSHVEWEAFEWVDEDSTPTTQYQSYTLRFHLTPRAQSLLEQSRYPFSLLGSREFGPDAWIEPKASTDLLVAEVIAPPTNRARLGLETTEVVGHVWATVDTVYGNPHFIVTTPYGEAIPRPEEAFHNLWACITSIIKHHKDAR